jgi:hypothetical protein
MIYQAIKNSLIEKSDTSSNLVDIPEMPVFHPTELEF